MKKTVVGSLALALIISLPLPLHSSDEMKHRRALIIGIDGGKGSQVYEQVFQNHRAPNLEKLMTDGKSAPCPDFKSPLCARAHSGPKTGDGFKWLTGPGWCSVLTGVDNNRTQVKDNDPKNLSVFTATSKFYPTFLKRLHAAGYHVAAGGVASYMTSTEGNAPEAEPGILDYECGVNKNLPLITPAMTSSCNLDQRYALDGKDPGRDQKLAAWLIHQVEDPEMHAVMGVFDQVDAQGHKSGFSDNPGYMAAITSADTLIGTVLAAVNKGVAERNEEWLIIVTADHGGHNIFFAGIHDVRPFEDDAIPFVVTTYGSAKPLKDLVYPVTHMDLHPTVMRWFGASSPQADGKVQALP